MIIHSLAQPQVWAGRTYAQTASASDASQSAIATDGVSLTGASGPGPTVAATSLAATGQSSALQAAGPAAGLTPAVLAGYIDHTLLKPEATADQIKKLCAEAREHRFASVCVQPSRVSLAAAELEGSGVMVCTVVGFPHGATSTAGKAAEVKQALRDGADEIDMVINVGALKDRNYDAVRADIAGVVEAAGGATVKVIIETSLLTREEKVKACELSQEAGAHFVKTSTGFNGGGATPEDIALMRATVGPEMGVKASGGVRDFAAAAAVIAAGATRIGASSSVAIVQGAPAAPGTGY